MTAPRWTSVLPRVIIDRVWGRQDAWVLSQTGPDAYDDDLSSDDIRVEKERGVSGTPIYNGRVQQVDYNPDWLGAAGVANAERMRKSDGSIRAILQAIKLPMLRAAWKVMPNDEETADAQDRKIAKFCHDHLIGATRRHEQWQTVLKHALLMLDFGFTAFEKVWTVDDDDYYVLQRLAPRLPQTITEIQANPDGTLKRLVQQGPDKSHSIPGRYTVMLSYDKEGDNFWGNSILRALWSHFYYKTELYRIDAIRLDRFGTGIPMAEIQAGYNIKPTEKTEVIEILRGMRSHERAYAMLPEQIKIRIMTPENANGGALGLMESVDHHDVMMARAVLALFLTSGSQKHGNYGSTESWQDLFLFALQGISSYICEEFNRSVIKELCDYNFDMAGRDYPRLSVSSLEDTNIKELAAALYNLVLGQVITADDTTEAHVRQLLGFPKLEEEQTRAARKLEEERKAEELAAQYAALGLPPPGVPQPKGAPGSPAEAAPNVITGKPSDNDRRAQKTEPIPGTKPSTTPPQGPRRAPNDRG